MKIYILPFFIFLSSFTYSNSYSKGSLFHKYIESTGFEGVVLVSEKDKILFHNSYGLANREHNVPMTTDMSFILASVSKQFTAAAILKLAEEGKVDLNTDISNYIKTPESWKGITLHNILSHTSGFKHWLFDKKVNIKIEDNENSYALEGYELEMLESFSPIEKRVELLKAAPLVDEAPLGTRKFSYSNAGYHLLAYLIEKVSGETFENYLKKSFYTPLKMNRTSEYKMTKIIPNQASGYVIQDKETTKACCYRYSHGAGSTYTTSKDMNTWIDALLNYKALTKESVDLLFTAHTKVRDDVFYGYGWQIGKFKGFDRVWHTGGGFGYLSVVDIIKGQGLKIIILSNKDDWDEKESTLGKLDKKALELYLNNEL